MAISLQERTSRRSKAIAIAAVLVVAGCDHTTARNLDDTGWQRAAAAAAHNTGHAWTDASPATRTIVVTLLEAHNMTHVDEDDDRDDYVRGVDNADHDLTAGRGHEAHRESDRWYSTSLDYRRGYNTRYTEGPAPVDHGEFDTWVNRD